MELSQFHDDGQILLTDGLNLLDNFHAAGAGDSDFSTGLQNQVKTRIAIVKQRRCVLSVGA